MLASWKENYDKLSILKSRDVTLPIQVCIDKAMIFPVVQMWELVHKEGLAPKNWFFRTVVLEKTLESPLDCKEIQPVNPEGNQSWVFIGKTDAEAEAPVFWPPIVKRTLTGKNLDDGKDWGQEEKGVTEDEMVGWHHRFNGHKFEKTLGDSGGQRSLTTVHRTTESCDWATATVKEEKTLQCKLLRSSSPSVLSWLLVPHWLVHHLSCGWTFFVCAQLLH